MINAIPNNFDGDDMSAYDDVVWAVKQSRLGGFNSLSTGQKVAAALMLNRFDWLESMGYTMAEAIYRLDQDWLAAIAARHTHILRDSAENS